MMKRILFLLLHFLISQALANLPEGHLLYPRDRLSIELIGIEPGLSLPAIKRQKNKCEQDLLQNHLCTILRDFHNPTNHLSSTQEFWRSETQFIFFGERHIDQQLQLELSAQLNQLSQDGFDHLALEMFNSSVQAQLDAYVMDFISIEEILLVLSRDWSYQNDGYRVLLETAKSLNMKIIALDDRKKHPINDTFSDDLIRRDQHMVEILKNYLDEKVVIYTGRLHAYKSFSLDGQSPVPTIMSELSKAKPELIMENYFLYTRKSSGLLANLLRLDSAPLIEGVIKIPALKSYIDGVVLSRFP